MTRKLLAALFFVPALAFLLMVRADDPAAKTDEPKKPDAPVATTVPVITPEDLAKEKLLREQFETFKNEVLKLKQRLESSDKDEDKQTVKVLDDVLKEISKQNLDTTFDKAIERLSNPATFKKMQDVGEVAKNNKELHDAMEKLI